MFVIIDEYGNLIERGEDLARMLFNFYQFQPNDDTSVFVYDIDNNQCTKIKYDSGKEAGKSIILMKKLVKSIQWRKPYKG
jgi:hypothetical protein